MAERFRGWFYGKGAKVQGREGDPPVQPLRRQYGTINPLIHKLAWEEYARQGHGNQSAERIAERGGFGTGEIIMLLADALLRVNGFPTEPASAVRSTASEVDDGGQT